MTFFFSAGEASGDAYAAELIEGVRALAPSARFEAVGGARASGAGATLVADSSHWGAIGIISSIGVGPRVLAGYRRAKRRLAQGPKGVFVPIDFGFVNVRLARFAKAHGWKVLYFVPPGSWRRTRQGRHIPKVSDIVVTPFPWSAEILRGYGADARWYGHPLKQRIAARGHEAGTGLAVLPGSRSHEIRANLPAIAGAVRDLDVPIEFAVATSLNAGVLRAMWERLVPGRKDTFTQGDTVGVLRRARAAVVCSGSATLEAALSHCPMVVVYRLAGVAVIEGRLRKPFMHIPFIALPNLILEREVVPELIQEAATPVAIRGWVDRLLGDTETRRAQLAAFTELDQLLGGSDAIDRAAAAIVELAERA